MQLFQHQFRAAAIKLILVLLCASLCVAINEHNSYGAEKPRVARCCPEGLVIKKAQKSSVTRDTSATSRIYCGNLTRNGTTAEHNIATDFSQMDVYTENLQLTNKTVMESFRIVDAAEMNINLNETEDFSWLMSSNHLKVYLTEEANIYGEFTNVIDRFKKMSSSQFCLGYRPSRNGLSLRFFTTLENNDLKKESIAPKTIIKVIALTVSCIFLTLTLVIYALLKELRNLRGLILMSCLVNFLADFLILVVFQIISVRLAADAQFCWILTLSTYFFTLASFFWLNVMSFDIWWTFRGMVMLRSIHRRGELCKYLVYCAYAWGVPLLMTAGLVILERADLSSAPNFIKPNIAVDNCFFKKTERLLYLYIPMLILLVANTILFVLTVINMSRVDSSKLRSSASSQPKRFVLYLKLAAVMGINWVLEVISEYFPGEMELVFDLYNGLIGIVIFFIFIYKGKTLAKLQTRYPSVFKSSIQWRQPSSQFSDPSAAGTTLSTSPHTIEESSPL